MSNTAKAINSEEMIQLPSLQFPDADDSWRDDARCKGANTDLFYPPRGSNGATAKLVCLGCSVRKQCCDFAVRNSLRDGIFGGLTDKERRKIRSGERTNDMTLADALKYAFHEVHHKFPSKGDQWFWRYSKDIIEIASRATGIPRQEIYDNIDNAGDYIL